MPKRTQVAIDREPADGDAARWCVQRYFELLDERFEGGYDPRSAAAVNPNDFNAPNGAFLIARLSGDPVGCGGVRRLAPELGEIKRLWVAETARGIGIGQQLLLALEDHARSMGMAIVRLDTNKSLTEARALYLKNGYRTVTAFNDDPYPDYWFEKRLDQI